MRKCFVHSNYAVVRSAALTGLLAIASPAWAEFSFKPLPDLGTGVIKISGDGRTVIGASNRDGRNHAAFWTEARGTVPIGNLPGGDGSSDAFGVSVDGRFIVGRSSSVNGVEAFLWSAEGGMVALGDLPGGGSFNSAASGVSADGKTVAGRSIASFPYRAFRWTATSGLTDLGNLGGSVSIAEAISCDGSVVVGKSQSANGDEAFMWTAATGMTALGAISGGGRTSSANAISADGRVIVGMGARVSFEAFRWSNGAAIALGTFDPQNPGSDAFGVSADGNVIVGQGSGRDADGLGEASVWFPNRGQLNLRKYLLDHGVPAVQGWLLVAAAGVSDDGRTIIGNGVSPEGKAAVWIARIEIDDVPTTPPPAPPPVVLSPVAPSNLSAVADAKSVTLRWIDNASNETGFRIERCQGNGCTSFTQIAQVNANVLTFIDTGRTKNTNYRYRIRAFNAAGNSTYSNIVAISTLRR